MTTSYLSNFSKLWAFLQWTSFVLNILYVYAHTNLVKHCFITTLPGGIYTIKLLRKVCTKVIATLFFINIHNYELWSYFKNCWLTFTVIYLLFLVQLFIGWFVSIEDSFVLSSTLYWLICVNRGFKQSIPRVTSLHTNSSFIYFISHKLPLITFFVSKD